MPIDRKTHWDKVYGRKSESQLSWHQDDPAVSLELIAIAGATATSSFIDIGGGTSRLARTLVASGGRDVTVLDVSQVALDIAKDRMGTAGATARWIAADITTWSPDRQFDVWHDRAVFHFLVDPSEQAAYLETLGRGLHIGGHALIATFTPEGPETCSGLPVARYDPSDLAERLGAAFDLVAHRHQLHMTPWGDMQPFQFSLLRRSH